jgi:uncharacterized protein (UPF0333 family)
MSRTTLAVLVILTVALAAWAGDTGLGTSPFTSGDQLTATAVNAMNDAIKLCKPANIRGCNKRRRLCL